MNRKYTLAALAALSIASAVVVISACGGGDGGGDSAGKSGNEVDKAFIRQMTDHHQLAIEMAQVAEGEGEHPEIKRLAQQIDDAQNREITEMTAIGNEIGAFEHGSSEGGGDTEMSGMDHTAGGGAMDADAATLGVPVDAMGMSMDAAQLKGAKPFDEAFIAMMVPHHTGAIAMAKAERTNGENEQLKTLADGIIEAQTREISEMESWRSKWFGAAS